MDAGTAINAVKSGELSFCKFLSANETGITGSHQVGIYISKPSIPILFNKPGIRGENKDKYVEINWNCNLTTTSRFIYYGQGTRNEYRITSFGRDFPYLREEYTGSLFVLIKNDEESYQAFILDTEEEINSFLDYFKMNPAQTNALIDIAHPNTNIDAKIDAEIRCYARSLEFGFPSAYDMSKKARELYLIGAGQVAVENSTSDKLLVAWTNVEYKLFRALEDEEFRGLGLGEIDHADDYLRAATSLLNRRKSRAGRSLENQLEALFKYRNLEFEAQVITEGSKRPDFIFPSGSAYHDLSFDTNKLISLAAKTTCKDRWRQILNEADRLKDKTKYLCTLQQGISKNQLKEMEDEKVALVVPKEFISSYPKEFREQIWTLDRFIGYVHETQGTR